MNLVGARRTWGALAASVLLGAALTVAAAPQPAHARPARPVAPAITAGGNGVIAWTTLTRDSLGGVDGGNLESTAGTWYGGPDDMAPRDPEWSPRGDALAFWAYSFHAADAGLWVLPDPFESDRAPVQLTARPSDEEPTWSPDGESIAFVRSGKGIYIIDADGGIPHRIYGEGYAEDLSWSPDGSKIAYGGYCCGYGTTQHVYLLDLATTTVTDLGLGLSPSWKPDGSKIVFESAADPADHDIYTMNPDGSGRTAIQATSVFEFDPVFSPDGTKIAFHRSGTGIWTVSATGIGAAVQVPFSADSETESTTWGSTQTFCQGRPTTISGTSGTDVIHGSSGVDVINALGGSDIIQGMQGQDVICGGPGYDTVTYAGQTAPVRAAIGETDPASGMSDLIAADVEALKGGDGPDYLVGDDRQNELSGGRGDDTLYGGGDADTVSGEGGDDLVVGDDGADQMSGDSGDDVLRGGGDDDVFFGGTGDDVLRGGDGDDTFFADDGGDLVVGGAGTMDLIDYTGRAQPVDVTIGAGPGDDGGKVDGAVGDRDTVTGSVENVTGGNGADTLIGNDLNNQIKGNAGADTMRGGEGRDLIRAVDGIADAIIDCGPDTDSNAAKDAIDPAPISCP